eukprot:261760-Ditylum_brightwellii.AAC.1
MCAQLIAHDLRNPNFAYQIQQHYSGGTNPHCQPNSTTYNAVVNTWAKAALLKNREEHSYKMHGRTHRTTSL